MKVMMGFIQPDGGIYQAAEIQGIEITTDQGLDINIQCNDQPTLAARGVVQEALERGHVKGIVLTVHP